MPSPLIAITMGDPAGIGPEIIVKALGEERIFAHCRPLVLGDEKILSYTIRLLKSRMTIKTIEEPGQGEFVPGIMSLMPVTDLSHEQISVGVPQKEGGEAAYQYIERGVKMSCAGSVEALITAPINKEALHRAGHAFPGHTEILASMTGTEDYVMMVTGPRLRVALATIHIPLREVPFALSIRGVRKTIVITFQGLRHYFGIADPRIAVAALNPHAGEGGLFGTEEEEVIIPALEQCRREGIQVEGPLAPDSLFFKAAQGQYDAIVCMYHDQGLIPIKTLHFWEGVNITLGLPIIRTSVDHGTGYDIAGQGVANHTSLINAIMVAAEMVMVKRRRI